MNIYFFIYINIWNFLNYIKWFTTIYVFWGMFAIMCLHLLVSVMGIWSQSRERRRERFGRLESPLRILIDNVWHIYRRTYTHAVYVYPIHITYTWVYKYYILYIYLYIYIYVYLYICNMYSRQNFCLISRGWVAGFFAANHFCQHKLSARTEVSWSVMKCHVSIACIWQVHDHQIACILEDRNWL